jgi:protein phosphatase
MAADSVAEFYERSRDGDATWPFKMDPQLGYAENRLVCGIKLANARIHGAASTDINRKGMGTTIVAVAIVDDEALVAHVGDSRIYRVRGRALEPVTRDHSLLEEYRKARPDLSEEEVAAFPHKNVITRALGMQPTVQVEVSHHPLVNGDRYLLCCDGLSGMVPDAGLLQCVAGRDDLDAVLKDLIDRANQAGGVDNITGILVAIEK